MIFDRLLQNQEKREQRKKKREDKRQAKKRSREDMQQKDGKRRKKDAGAGAGAGAGEGAGEGAGAGAANSYDELYGFADDFELQKQKEMQSLEEMMQQRKIEEEANAAWDLMMAQQAGYAMGAQAGYVRGAADGFVQGSSEGYTHGALAGYGMGLACGGAYGVGDGVEGEFSQMMAGVGEPTKGEPTKAVWRPAVRQLVSGTEGIKFTSTQYGHVWNQSFICLYLSNSVKPLSPRGRDWCVRNIEMQDYPDPGNKAYKISAARVIEHLMHVFKSCGSGSESVITYAVKVYTFMWLMRSVDLQPRQGNDPNECAVVPMTHARGGDARRGKKAVKKKTGTLAKPDDNKRHLPEHKQEAEAMVTELCTLVRFKRGAVDIPDQEFVLDGVMSMFNELSEAEKESIVANSTEPWWDSVPKGCERQWEVIKQISLTLALYVRFSPLRRALTRAYPHCSYPLLSALTRTHPHLSASIP